MTSHKVEVTLTHSSSEEPFSIRQFTLSAESPAEPIGRSSRRHTERGVPGPDNALFINSVASRDHAELFIDPDSDALSLKVQDHDSMHGTFVDGKKLGFEPVELKSGANIRIGNDIENGDDVHRALAFVVTFRWTREKRAPIIDLSSPPGSPLSSDRPSRRYVVPYVESSDEEPDERIFNTPRKPNSEPLGRCNGPKSSMRAILNPSGNKDSSQNDGSRAKPWNVDDGDTPQGNNAVDNQKSPSVVSVKMANCSTPATQKQQEGSNCQGGPFSLDIANNINPKLDNCSTTAKGPAIDVSPKEVEKAATQTEQSKGPEDFSDLDGADCESYVEEEYNFTPEPSDSEYDSESSLDLQMETSKPNEQQSEWMKPVVSADTLPLKPSPPAVQSTSPREGANGVSKPKTTGPANSTQQCPLPPKPASCGFPSPNGSMMNFCSPMPRPPITPRYPSYPSQPHPFYPVHGITTGPWGATRSPQPPFSPVNGMPVGWPAVRPGDFSHNPTMGPYTRPNPSSTRNTQGSSQQSESSKIATSGPDLSRMSIPNIITGSNDKNSSVDPACRSKRKSDMMSSDDKAQKERSGTSNLSQMLDRDHFLLTQGFSRQEPPSLFSGGLKRTPDLKKLSAPVPPQNVATEKKDPAKVNKESTSKPVNQATNAEPTPQMSASSNKETAKTAEIKKANLPAATILSPSAPVPAPQKTQAVQTQAAKDGEPASKKVCCTKVGTSKETPPRPLAAADRPDRVRARRQNYKDAAATFAGGVLVGSVGLMTTLLTMPESWFS